jgi:SAM-dependent methyltransferase
MSLARVCPGCGRGDPAPDGGPVWPADWRCRACGHATIVRQGIPLTAPALADTISGIDPAGFDYLARAELDHFWFVARRRLILALAGKHAPRASRFLEIGCGSGNVINALARSRAWTRIVGMDIHPSGLSLARARLPAEVELLQGDVRAIPFRGGFDLVGAFDVLEHVAEDEKAIAGVRAALDDGGIFLTTVPQHPTLWSTSDEVAHHKRRYARRELDRKIAAAGFEILFSTSYAVSLLPLMLVHRKLADARAGGVDLQTVAGRELEVTPVINRILTLVLNAETAFTRRGVRWPVGGSRVIAARKR